MMMPIKVHAWGGDNASHLHHHDQSPLTLSNKGHPHAHAALKREFDDAR